MNEASTQTADGNSETLCPHLFLSGLDPTLPTPAKHLPASSVLLRSPVFPAHLGLHFFQEVFTLSDAKDSFLGPSAFVVW